MKGVILDRKDNLVNTQFITLGIYYYGGMKSLKCQCIRTSVFTGEKSKHQIHFRLHKTFNERFLTQQLMLNGPLNLCATRHHYY